MVNYGKPSRGCQTCKSRRIKCDLAKPSCQRCISTGRECPGVPEETDLLFRNQTDTVSLKAKRAKKREATVSNRFKKGAAPANSSTEAWSSSEEATPETAMVPFGTKSTQALRVAVTPQEVSRGLPFSIESKALSFFWSNFVPNSDHSVELVPFLQTLAPIYSQSLSTSPLHHATCAMAMTGLGNYERYGYVKAMAGQAYGKALRLLGKAINDPIQAKSDETLLTTLMLLLYECQQATQNSTTTYEHHLRGAAALVRVRGESSFESEKGRKLFRSIRRAMIIDAIHQAQPLSTPEMRSFWYEKDGDPDASNQTSKLFDCAVSIPDLRARANESLAQPRTAESEEQVKRLLADVKVCDESLEAWFLSLPSDYLYNCVPYPSPLHSATSPGAPHSIVWEYLKDARRRSGTQSPTPSQSTRSQSPTDDEISNNHTYPGDVHVYNDVYCAAALNHYRVFRIWLAGIAFRCLAYLAPPSEVFRSGPRYKRTLAILRTMVDDICASVPYHLGYAPGQKLAFFQGLQTEAEWMKERDKKAREAMGAYFLLWPLYVASCVECIPDTQKAWLRNRLSALAYGYGYKQALVYREAKTSIVASEKPLNPWDIIGEPGMPELNAVVELGPEPPEQDQLGHLKAPDFSQWCDADWSDIFKMRP